MKRPFITVFTVKCEQAPPLLGNNFRRADNFITPHLQLCSTSAIEKPALLQASMQRQPYSHNDKAASAGAVNGTAGYEAVPAYAVGLAGLATAQSGDTASLSLLAMDDNARKVRLEQLRFQARTQVTLAMQAIPFQEKAEYLEAMEKAPQLLAPNAEADPMKFVRRCSYNTTAAAKHLTNYWRERKRLFGDRAYLPMNITGHGAMNERDILSLHGGFPALLPRTKDGKQVILVDRRQHVPSMSMANRHRGNMYLSHIMNLDDSAQTDGVLCLVLLALPRLQDYNHEGMYTAFKASRECLPQKAHIHLLNLPPTSKAAAQSNKIYEVQDLVTSYIDNLMKGGYDTSDITAHFEREKGQLYKELLELGLTHEGIPETLGGAWTFNSFAAWCQERAREELRSCPIPGTLDGNQQQSSDATEIVTSQDKKRLKSIIHSRQKRARRRQEMEDLKNNHQRLVAENTRLKADNQLLQSLVQQAEKSLGKV